MYRFELVTAPASEPVTRAEAKTHLRESSTDEDDLIDGLIVAARKLVEAQTSRQLVTATWRLHLDCFPAGDIQIRKSPIASISSITYYDTNGDSQTWASSNYETDLVSEPARIRPAYNVSYPSTRSGKPNAVTVQFVAGVAQGSVDQRAKQAILLLLSHWYENREAVVMGSFSELPMAAQSLINSLRWTAYAGVF